MQNVLNWFNETHAAVYLIAGAVLLLLLGLLLAFWSYNSRRIRVPGAGRARQPRLGVVDAFNLDRERQLVLIRRDNVEHLIMLGGRNDVVIESQILRVEPRTREKDGGGPSVAVAPASLPIFAAQPTLQTAADPTNIRRPVAASMSSVSEHDERSEDEKSTRHDPVSPHEDELSSALFAPLQQSLELIQQQKASSNEMPIVADPPSPVIHPGAVSESAAPVQSLPALRQFTPPVFRRTAPATPNAKSQTSPVSPAVPAVQTPVPAASPALVYHEEVTDASQLLVLQSVPAGVAPAPMERRSHATPVAAKPSERFQPMARVKFHTDDGKTIEPAKPTSDGPLAKSVSNVSVEESSVDLQSIEDEMAKLLGRSP